jgi:DtxR family Mn-dependent transcriptional regulator
VSYERYRGVRLTDAGRQAALRTIRRHRVIEAWLNKALGYPWDRVHEEAERLEHAASDELIDRMAAAIGEPHTDPHGHPIPTRDGMIDETQHRTLSDLAAGQRSKVMRVSDEDSELLRYLARIGIRPGVIVMLAERAPFDGPLTLRIGKATVQVGPALASRVMVESLPD